MMPALPTGVADESPLHRQWNSRTDCFKYLRVHCGGDDDTGGLNYQVYFRIAASQVHLSFPCFSILQMIRNVQ